MKPRVLLVDDDAAVRRFVGMALEDLDIDLLAVSRVAEAVAALRQGGPVQLILTDLMLPGDSGFSLLQTLIDEPALRGTATLVALSAGLDAATRDRLATLGVAQALHKPVSVGELESCVRSAVGLAESASQASAGGPASRVMQSDAQAAAPSPPPGPAPSLRVPQSAAIPPDSASELRDASSLDTAGTLDPAEAAALREHFGGEISLFLTFRALCRTQFSQDVVEGRVAAAQGDLPTLQRLGHSLKSVLATLGRPALAAQARRLEEAGGNGDMQVSRQLWGELATALELESAGVHPQ